MNPISNIPIGATAVKSIAVTRELTVAHFHEHMPEVYGTPMMIYLMEVTCSEAIQKYLAEGWVSVGAVVNIEHRAPTPIGFIVTAESKVLTFDDKEVIFSVEVHDGVEKIGQETHIRVPVELSRFNKSASQVQAGPEMILNE